MEETDILTDMSVKFRDFAVETRFVVAIRSGHVRHFPQGPQVDRCRFTLHLIVLMD